MSELELLWAYFEEVRNLVVLCQLQTSTSKSTSEGVNVQSVDIFEQH